MSRDHRKLRVFAKADTVVLEIYRITANFPREERFELTAQIRRSALSTACSIVEGSARRSTAEYVNFLNIASGSAAETRYLLDLAKRLDFVADSACAPLEPTLTELCAGLHALIESLGGRDDG